MTQPKQLKEETNNPMRKECCENGMDSMGGCIDHSCLRCHQSPDKCEHQNLKRDSKNCPDCGEEMVNLDEIISDNSIRELLIEREKLIHIRKHISIMDEFIRRFEKK